MAEPGRQRQGNGRAARMFPAQPSPVFRQARQTDLASRCFVFRESEGNCKCWRNGWARGVAACVGPERRLCRIFPTGRWAISTGYSASVGEELPQGTGKWRDAYKDSGGKEAGREPSRERGFGVGHGRRQGALGTASSGRESAKGTRHGDVTGWQGAMASREVTMEEPPAVCYALSTPAEWIRRVLPYWAPGH